MWKAANRGHAGAVSALLDGGASPTYGKTGKLWLVTSTLQEEVRSAQAPAPRQL
jgi:hypothetical protein